MGYDMRWCRVDDAEREAVQEASKLFHEVVNLRDAIPRLEAGRFNRVRADEIGDWDAHEAYDGRTDRYRQAQDRVNAAYAAMRDAEKSYFQLNIWGMGRYRDLMTRLGMAFEGEPHPSWPKTENYGITDEQFWAAEDPEDYPEVFASITPEVMEKVLAYQAEHTRVLSWHGKEIPGIPLHKFSSNDGWIVLPAECEAALRTWQEYCGKHGAESALGRVGRAVRDTAYWLEWLEFLAGAARHDGFEVW
jgi:hypothetical protein